MNLSLRTATRIAWRETRSSMVKFTFVVLGVAAGVGALSGVRGFSQSFEGMLTSEARTVMAADLTARQFVLPTPDQTAPARRAGQTRRRADADYGDRVHGYTGAAPANGGRRCHAGAGFDKGRRSLAISLLR